MLPRFRPRVAGLAAAAAFCGLLSIAPAHAAVPTDFVDELVASGLSSPIGFAFLPDGRALVAEQRSGSVRLVRGGTVSSALFTVPSLNTSGGERGLLAIAVDPQWPTRPYVYLFWTRTGSFLRLARYTASGDLTNPGSSNITLGSAYLVLDDLPDQAWNHNGGTLRFDDDGYLYLSLGEDADPCSAQDPSQLKGVLLRLDVDGLPAGAGGPATRAQLTPADNPFVGSSNTNERLVWAYGLRNPFRFALDPVTGKAYVGDVGQDLYEEFDEVEAGDNLGWPHREGFQGFSPGCSPPGGFSPRAPIAAYDHGAGVAVMGIGPYRPRSGGTSNWPPEYDGDVLYADYYGGFIRRLSWNGTDWVSQSAPGQPSGSNWASGLSSPVDFGVGPDGSLYWLSQGGTLRRIRYTGTTTGVGDRVAAGSTIHAVSPFTTTTQITFTLEREGHARIAAYDVHGRVVRTLIDGNFAPGARQLAWDGRDDDGRSVPSGMYLLRLDHAGGRAVTRAMRLR